MYIDLARKFYLQYHSWAGNHNHQVSFYWTGSITVSVFYFFSQVRWGLNDGIKWAVDIRSTSCIQPLTLMPCSLCNQSQPSPRTCYVPAWSYSSIVDLVSGSVCHSTQPTVLLCSYAMSALPPGPPSSASLLSLLPSPIVLPQESPSSDASSCCLFLTHPALRHAQTVCLH